MSEIDYVVRNLTVKQEAVTDFSALYKVLKKWFEDNRYDLLEKEYIDILKDKEKELSIKWAGEKKVDEYTKFVIEIKIKGREFAEVYVKGKKFMKGEIVFKIESLLEKDYEDVWENRPIAKFIRGVYDKFILAKHFSDYEEKLREDTYAIHSEIKAFLNLQKF